jgi:hypothetical protein
MTEIKNRRNFSDEHRGRRGALMRGKVSLSYSFDLIVAGVAAIAVLAVLQTFVIGRHFIIPTVLLAMAVLLGNLAWQGLQDRPWAKHVLFWCGFVFTCHLFFALFWASRYRELLGVAFVPTAGGLTLVFAYLAFQYARRNRLFRRPPAAERAGQDRLTRS